MILRNLCLSPDGVATGAAPKQNSQKIRVESNEGKVPEAIAGMNFNTEQLPSLSEDEGRPASVEEVKGDDKAVLPAEKKEEFKPKVVEKEAEEKEKPESELTEKTKPKEELTEIERFLKPPKGSQAEKELQAKKGSKDTFDYSQHNEEEASILKNMPAGNREKISKLFKEQKELSKVKENQFYQSPEGYLLHPGYKAEVNAINLAEREARIWSKMLKDVKEGIAIKPLEGWNTKTGEPVFGAEVKATDEMEEVIRNNFNQCLAIASEKRNAVGNFVKNFPQLAAKDMQVIREERSKRFAWVADSKLLDHTISVDGVGEKSIRQVRSDVASLFPAYMRNNEAVEACGDLMVALMIAKAELSEMKKENKVVKTKKEEERSIEPGSDVRPKKTTEPVHGVKVFTMEGSGIEQ